MSDLQDAVRREKERWKTDTSGSAAWDARALVDKLRKGGEPGTAVEFGEQAIVLWPAFEPLHSAVAWAYYTRDIALLDPDDTTAASRQTAKSAVARIRQLVDADPYGKFSAWPLAVLRVARVAQVRWPRAALDLLTALDPTKLNNESSSDFPSPAGRWHLGITKALEELERWDELLGRCDAALIARDALRLDDQRWVRRRRALALEHLGRATEAAAILREIQLELPEWWVEADLARALAAAGEEDEAMEACRRALGKPGDLPPRWRTAFLLAQLLEKSDRELSSAHYQFARHLRAQAGWPPDRELEARATAFGIADDAPSSLDLTGLRRSWRDAHDPSRGSGVVKAVLDGEHSGFISADGSGEDLYFAMPRNSSRAAPSVGTRVTFRAVDSFDKKKNKPSRRAVDIRAT